MSMSSTSEPREPVVLRYQISDLWKISKMSEELSEHIVPQHKHTALPPCSSQDRPLCAYFYFYYNHYHQCNVKTIVCQQCCKVLRWIEHHARACKSLTLEGCFELCTKMKEKKFRLSSRIVSEDLDDITSKGDKDSDTSSGASSGSFTYPGPFHREPSVSDSLQPSDVFSPHPVLESKGEMPQKVSLVRSMSIKSASSVESTGRFQKGFCHQISHQSIEDFPQDTICSPRDTNCSPLDTNCSPLDTNCSPLDILHSPLDALTSLHLPQNTFRLPQDTLHSPQDTPHSPQDTPHLPQEIPCSPLDATPLPPPQNSVPLSPGLERIRGLEGEAEKMEMEEEVAIREVDHRAKTRECLLKQLRNNGGYRENEHWVRVRRIGCGGFGTCFCILDNKSNYLLAMKEGKIDFHAENACLDETYICLKLARLISSKPLHVVEFFGANIIPFPHYTIVQLFEELMSSSLYDMIKNNGPLIIDDVIHYAYQMFDALDFLHTKLKIVHCDIKPANLLLDVTNQRLKVADFGSAVLIRECNYGPVFSGSPGAGTLHFNPPEFYRDQTCSRAFDIWQAGCCVLNMCTGRRPWRHLYMDTSSQSLKMHQRYLISQQSTHVIPSFLPEGLQRLLCDCLHSDYKCRPIAQQCQSMLVALEGDHVKKSIDNVMRDESTYYAASAYTNQSRNIANTLDVYVCTEIVHCHQLLRPGWLGSIECPSPETLSTPDQLWQYLETSLPVFKQLPSNCTIATCDHTPLAIWQGLKRSDCLPVEIWNHVSRRSPIAIGRWQT